ncbi:hypothetical protein BC629DRAFT_1512793, partial [Irpex lacteus]
NAMQNLREVSRNLSFRCDRTHVEISIRDVETDVSTEGRRRRSEALWRGRFDFDQSWEVPLCDLCRTMPSTLTSIFACSAVSGQSQRSSLRREERRRGRTIGLVTCSLRSGCLATVLAVELRVQHQENTRLFVFRCAPYLPTSAVINRGCSRLSYVLPS